VRRVTLMTVRVIVVVTVLVIVVVVLIVAVGVRLDFVVLVIVMMTVFVTVVVVLIVMLGRMLTPVEVRAIFVKAEFRGSDALSQDALGADPVSGNRQAAQRAPQFVERKAGVKARAQNHVARGAGEAVEVENGPHASPSYTSRRCSRKL
jgi:hypothetical protein